MSAENQRKVVIVTGASRGIGKAIALRFGRDGANLIVNYNSNKTEADKVVTEIGVTRAIAVKADVSHMEEVKRLVKTAVDKWGKVDVLVNSAGILPMKDLKSTTEEDFDRTFALNVKGPYFLTQVCIFSIHSIITCRKLSNICLPGVASYFFPLRC
jgi:3-oxoacyl-[acyl-carrier protein] reductase